MAAPAAGRVFLRFAWGPSMVLRKEGALGRARALTIPIPDGGRGHAFFLLKDVASHIQLPSRRMLREESRRRLKAARKKKWAEYRQAKETALGKPMRRVRASC